MSTSHVLCEYAEKIMAALAIYNLQNRYSFDVTLMLYITFI